MQMNSVSRTGYVNVKQSRVSDKSPKKESVQEPQDKITLGKVAKDSAKIVSGVVLGAVVGAGKGLLKGAKASSEAALQGLGMKEGDKKTIGGKVAEFGMKLAPVLGAATAYVAGAAPLGVIAAAFMAPGAIAGVATAGAGALKGGADGVKVALKVSKSADKAVAKRLGKYAGKAAQFATGVAMGIVAAPVMAFMGAVKDSFNFAERAIGIKENPETVKDAANNLLGETALISGAALGVIGSGGGAVAIASGAASGAGVTATFIKGTAGAVEGYVDGMVKGYKAAGQAIDTITG